MDFLSLCIIVGIIIILSRFIYELKDPNKLSKDAKTHESPQSERSLFYTATYISISLQCYYMGHYVASVYYQVDDSDIVWSNGLFLIGLVVCIAGSCLRTKAKQQLGEFFTYQLGVSEGQRLITHGLYSHLMHPSYLGLCMIFLGTSIAYQSVILVATFVQMVLAAMIRISKEEEMLENMFGKEFHRYSENRWRMLPFVF